MDVLPSNGTLKLISTSVLALGLIACGGGSSAPDTTAPTVSSTTPADNASSVARSSDLTATFDEDMFASTVGASSFTLANAGATNITGTVTFNGVTNVATFSPNSALGMLASYTATLTTAITDLSGNALATDYNWSFTTADGNWGTAVLVEPSFSSNAASPQIAFDTSGNAIAVWQQKDGLRIDIWANYFASGSWGAPERIDTADGDATDPQIAFDASGKALAVWPQLHGGSVDIMARRFEGGSWGEAQLVESDTNAAHGAFDPQIAFDASGNALAVWIQGDGLRFNIWANSFNGSSWGAAELIEFDNTGHAEVPQIAFDANGNALAVWQQYDANRSSIWANRFNGSNWEGPELIEANDTHDAFRPQIAIDANGNALAVWQEYDGIRFNIWANRFEGGNWGEAKLIEIEDAGHATLPQIAIDASGNALAVWQQHDGASWNIWASRFDGNDWGSARKIETVLVDATSPQIAVDASGNALAVWRQKDGTRTDIWANRFDGSNWGTAELIEASNVGDAEQPQIAIDTNGNALSVWRQSDGSNFNIRGNRFE